MLRILPVLFLTLAASAQQTFVSQFEVAGLSCDGCAATATDALRKLPGVVKAEVVFETRQGRVEAKRKIEDNEIRKALAKFGYEARFPNDPVAAPLTAEERAKLDIQVASSGEAFDVKTHVAKGKYTIFDFWAEWCGPCHVLTPKIERLVQENANVAMRTVELPNWDTAAAKQATKEFRVAGLPYVRVYGPDGKFAGEVLGNDIEKIKKLVGAAK